MNQNLKNRKNPFNYRPMLALLVFVFGLAMLVHAQKTYVYSGTVTGADGTTMPGVSVVVKGTTTGTATDIDGKYKIITSNPAETLVFSFVGAQTQEVQVLGNVPTSVVMQDKAIGLNELVVVGYGTQRKSVSTGAIAQVKSKDFEKQAMSRVDQALQGRTAGVQVTANSGSPGSGSTIRVRGITTLNDNSPLYIVDGMPIDEGGMNFLNPSDIASIEVLKDAASQAIYGTRAAAGVILITTKKGESGKLNINFHNYYGIQMPTHKMDMCNATEYATLKNEANINAGRPPIYDNPQALGEGTDWQDAIFNNRAGIELHDLSVSGGNEKATFFTSLAYFRQEGIVTSDISNFNRLNIRFNGTYKFTNWLRMGTNFALSHEKSQGSLNTNSEYGGPLSSAINLDPLTPIIETNPDYTVSPYNQPNLVMTDDGYPYGISSIVAQEMTNPIAYTKTREGNYGWADNLVGNAYLEFEPIKALVFKSDIGIKKAYWGQNSFTGFYYLNNYNSSSKTSFYKEKNTGLAWSFENTVTYRFNIQDHHFSALAGTGAYVSGITDYMGITYNNIPATTFEEATFNYSIPTENIIAWGSEGIPDKLASAFFRLNYDFSEKYLFTGSLRRDGSSKFGRNNKFGFFPAFSLGWVVSREDFWPKNTFVDFLKFRGSYGVVGNASIGNFKYVSIVQSGSNYSFGSNDTYYIGYNPLAPENPDLKWEQTASLNFGFESTIFENVTLNLDWFNKKTTGILMDNPIPAYVGADGNPVANLGTMVNKGLELELGYRKNIGKLELDAKANVTYLHNEIEFLRDTLEFLPNTGSSFQNSAYQISRYALGHSYNEFYGFEVLGIFQNIAEINHYESSDGTQIQPNAKPGDFQYADLNDDGKITEADRTFIGNPTPAWSFGATVNATYGRFDINMFLQGVSGNKIFNAMRRLDIPTANWSADALDRWTEENPSTTYPRLDASDANHNFSYPSSFFLSNGSYLRLKTIQIGYSVPSSLFSKTGISNLRVYLSSNNLFTITKYNGFDPEIGGSSFGIDRGIYPQARSFIVGINLGI